MTTLNRRDLLKTSLAAMAGSTLPYWWTSSPGLQAFGFETANERPVVGCIGVGGCVRPGGADRLGGGVQPTEETKIAGEPFVPGAREL